MGMNSYMVKPFSKGYNTETAATVIQTNIDGDDGNRIAVQAYEAAGGDAANKLYFMLVGSRTTIATGSALGAATVTLTAALTDPAGNAIAANDVICIKQDDGTYHFTTVSSWTSGTLTLVVNDVFTAAVGVGKEVWCFGVVGDEGHIVVQMGAGAGSASVDGGLFFAKEKGDPMPVLHANATTAGSINYITGAYINV